MNIEKSINSPVKAKVLCVAIAASLAGFMAPASADTASDLQALKAQIQALQNSIAALEQKQTETAKAVAPANSVTAGTTPGSFKLPGSNTSVKFGGYVKADLLYSDTSTGVGSTSDQLLVPGSIALTDDNEDGQVTLHARQTRLNFATSTPTAWGELKTFVEADFFGANGNEIVSNSNGLRTRHAFGSLGGLLAGQTWSTFMDAGSLPETLDFGGPVGELFVRQTQVRWTEAFDGGSWSVAAESPESFLTTANAGGGTNAPTEDDKVPDLVARLDFNTSVGRFALAALARNIRVDTATADDSQWGGALAAYGVVPTVGKDTFQFSLTAGNALGRYMGQAVFTDGDGDGAGNLSLNNQWGAIVAYRHFWTDSLRSTVALSTARASNSSEAMTGNMNQSADTAHLNLLWSPIASTTFGLELIHAKRETEDGRSGDLNRLQTSAQYNF
jgi:hypothetical protein